MQIEEVELLTSEDLIELGMRAYAERHRLHPGWIVTYCLDPAASSREILDWQDAQLEALNSRLALVPVCPAGKTAVDYLRLLAVCRLQTNVQHIQVDIAWTGLKLAQVALRFGADDLINSKPGNRVPEEEIRRAIRDAGFIPKRRDPEFSPCWTKVLYLADKSARTLASLSGPGSSAFSFSSPRAARISGKASDQSITPR